MSYRSVSFDETEGLILWICKVLCLITILVESLQLRYEKFIFTTEYIIFSRIDSFILLLKPVEHNLNFFIHGIKFLYQNAKFYTIFY